MAVGAHRWNLVDHLFSSAPPPQGTPVLEQRPKYHSGSGDAGPGAAGRQTAFRSSEGEGRLCCSQLDLTATGIVSVMSRALVPGLGQRRQRAPPIVAGWTGAEWVLFTAWLD